MSYSASFYKEVARELTDKIPLDDYRSRIEHYKKKLDEDTVFEDGANILMNELYTIEMELTQSPGFSEDREYRIINAMISFFPNLKGDSPDDHGFKERTAETLKAICEKAVRESSNPYFVSLAEETLENKVLDIQGPQ